MDRKSSGSSAQIDSIPEGLFTFTMSRPERTSWSTTQVVTRKQVQTVVLVEQSSAAMARRLSMKPLLQISWLVLWIQTM